MWEIGLGQRLGVRLCNQTLLFSAPLKGRRAVTWSTVRPELPGYIELLVPDAGCPTARKQGWPQASRAGLEPLNSARNAAPGLPVSQR